MALTTYLEAIRQGIFEEMRRDTNVFCIGEDVGVYGGAFKVTEGILDEFGAERAVDAPISEAAIIGAACGAALMGMRPIAEMQFIDFISCGFDMITNYAATSRYRQGLGIPMVVRGPSGAGTRGGPFHSLNPEAFFMNTPGLKMVAPSSAYDAKGLIKAAIRDDDPVLYFEYKFLYRRIKEELPDEDYIVPIGKASVKREGKDLSIITYGPTVHTALEAAQVLESENIDVEILDLRTILPYDKEAILTTVKKNNKVMLLHEATLTGGVAGELSAFITQEAFEYLDGPIVRIASIDTPTPYSPPLEDFFLPSVTKIVDAARKLAKY